MKIHIYFDSSSKLWYVQLPDIVFTVTSEDEAHELAMKCAIKMGKMPY